MHLNSYIMIDIFMIFKLNDNMHYKYRIGYVRTFDMLHVYN